MFDITKPAIHRIEEIAASIPGWTPVDELFALFTLVYATVRTEGDIIELGSWCGRSSVVLGYAAAMTGNTKVHCVDLFPSVKIGIAIQTVPTPLRCTWAGADSRRARNRRSGHSLLKGTSRLFTRSMWAFSKSFLMLWSEPDSSTW